MDETRRVNTRPKLQSEKKNLFLFICLNNLRANIKSLANRACEILITINNCQFNNSLSMVFCDEISFCKFVFYVCKFKICVILVLRLCGGLMVMVNRVVFFF